MAISYLTSNTLIESVKNKALIPTTQQTFTPDDFLRFANEEMMMGILPLVEQFHEEFFIYEEAVALNNNQIAYEIPYRASGNKLRSLYLLDQNQNRFPMARISSDDLEYYQGNYSQAIAGFYIANNTVNLLGAASQNGGDRLLFSYYMRPNRLVKEDRVAKITFAGPSPAFPFLNTDFITQSNILNLPNHNLVSGVSGTFAFGGTGINNFPYSLSIGTTYYITVLSSVQIELFLDSARTQPANASTAWSLSSSNINLADNTIKFDTSAGSNSLNGAVLQFDNMGTLPSPLVANTNYFFKKMEEDDTYQIFADQNLTVPVVLTTLGDQSVYTARQILISAGYTLQTDTVDIVVNKTPSIFNMTELYDLTQANSPHKTLRYDVEPLVMFGTTLRFAKETMRRSIDDKGNTPVYIIPKKGDYVSLAGETIIPQIPDELHSMLAQRVACRCLEALGDREGLGAANAKLAEMESKTAILINNRVEGSPQKVVNHNSPLRQRFYGFRGGR